MDNQAKDNKTKLRKIEVDTGYGSMSYNRFELQISQTLHMAIEIFDNPDYLFLVDYCDDITIFDKESDAETVSYFQMKTNEESISINTAITKDWLIKMYTKLENTDELANELGLTTNCPLVFSVTTKIDYNSVANKIDMLLELKQNALV